MAEALPVQDALLSSNATWQGVQSVDTSFRCQIPMERLTQTFREDTLENLEANVKGKFFHKVIQAKENIFSRTRGKTLGCQEQKCG
jgi:hypothetical protein